MFGKATIERLARVQAARCNNGGEALVRFKWWLRCLIGRLQSWVNVKRGKEISYKEKLALRAELAAIFRDNPPKVDPNLKPLFPSGV
jgi:hypothetical protein